MNRIEHSALAQAGELPAPTLLPSSWVGFRTLLYKEVLRFWKVAFQTIAAPVLTGVLYLLVFGHVLDQRVEAFAGDQLLGRPRRARQHGWGGDPSPNWKFELRATCAGPVRSR